jgi:hypothetical protein
MVHAVEGAKPSAFLVRRVDATGTNIDNEDDDYLDAYGNSNGQNDDDVDGKIKDANVDKDRASCKGENQRVRKACLSIPRPYSYRIQRLPPLDVTSIPYRNVEESNENKNDGEHIGPGDDHDVGARGYYFPAADSEEWFCAYRRDIHVDLPASQ